MTEPVGRAKDNESGGDARPDIDQVERLYAHPLIAREMFEGTPVGINLTDVKGRVLATNPAFARMVGRSEADLRKRTFDSITHPADRETDRSLFGELLAGRRDFYRIEKRYVRPDGRVVWVRLSVSLIRDADGSPRFTVGVAEDITDRKEAEERLRESERRFSDAFEQSPIGMALVGLDGHWLRVNRSLCELLGYPEQELVRANIHDLTHPDDQEADLVIMQRLLAGEEATAETEKRYFHRSGRIVWVRVKVTLVSRSDGTPWYFISQAQDLTEFKRAQDALHTLLEQQKASLGALEYAARHDSLTGLPNRSLFMDRLHHAVISARRQRSMFSLLLLDLDGFKSVNDTYGHAAGDACLIELARRLKVVLRGADTVARLGGDEFVVLLSGANEVVARTVAEKLRLLASMPIDLGEREVELGISLGIAVFPSMGDDARSLLHAADMAMYAAKREARSAIGKSPVRDGITRPGQFSSSPVA